MKVVLLKDIPGIGKSGEFKEVKDGYARNYLIPRGLAKPATEGEVKRIQNEKNLKVHKEDLTRKKSEEMLKILQRQIHKVHVKVGGGGKLFGALTSVNLAEVLSRETNLEIDKKWIHLEKPLKEVGLYDIQMHLPGGVKGVIKLEVVGEEKG
ncbi:MAG TPA: 50S ribosomal protein L9 [Pseudothermotoga sp.]|uniref:50S ribosomal protein L9 n=1 Tax=Thermotoga profunda TaxID=1508420 RepID=UPI0005979C58|nr:50S ribosomal protein L9 [Thermotoga profunda]